MKIDTVGTYTLKYTAADSCGNSTSEDRTVNVVPPIYGAEWDGSANSTMTRTDLATNFTDPIPAVNNGTGSSPFDDIMPWSGMRRFTDNLLGEMVFIPEFYYKWTMNDGGGFKVQISNGEIEGFFQSKQMAVARYLCDSTWESKTNAMPISDVNNKSASSGIASKGRTKGKLLVYNAIRAIWMLYLVEFANTNCQHTIGLGCSENGSIEVTGATDVMQYHTGTNATSRDSYGVTQYRFIEGLWNNVASGISNVSISGSYALHSSGETIALPSANGYIKGLDCKEYSYKPDKTTEKGQFVFPTSTVSFSSGESYMSDQYVNTSDNSDFAIGGRAFRSPYNGIFRTAGVATPPATLSDVGARSCIYPY